MIKNIFHISIVLGVLDLILFYYYNSSAFQRSHNEILAGLNQIIFTVTIFALLIIWWVVYFIITKDYSKVRIAVLLILVPIASITFEKVNSKLKDIQNSKSEALWRSRVQELNYNSESLGITFNYISESEFFGRIIISESDNIINIKYANNDKYSDVLEIQSKTPNTTLVQFLQDKYSKDYPQCRLAEGVDDARLFRNSNTNYSVVSMYGDDKCPKGNEVNNNKTLFIMDKNKLNRYAIVNYSDYSPEAYSTNDEGGISHKWFETIRFK